ncbi:hypothetical protein KP509_1Z048500 [Ceratopteris richardii]|nr:hypothetical protein KP509_1Z048500 [Ceratopteris richardii]
MVVIDEFPSSTLPWLLCSNEFNEARQRRENPACSSSLSFSGSVTKNSLRRHSAVTRIRPLVGTFTRHSRCRKSFPTLIVQSFPDDVSATTAVVSTTLATLIGFGGFRLFVYFRIQYMIAAMLGRYVPRGGSKVLDMDIHEGRNLYYYPSDVATVIAIATEKNREVIKAQG